MRNGANAPTAFCEKGTHKGWQHRRVGGEPTGLEQGEQAGLQKGERKGGWAAAAAMLFNVSTTDEVAAELSIDPLMCQKMLLIVDKHRFAATNCFNVKESQA